jgi:Zn-dependent peptidase ImmA (M78 family)
MPVQDNDLLLTPALAKHLAEDLLANRAPASIHVPVRALAESEGAHVVLDRMVTDGSLTRSDDAYVIRVSIDSSMERKRFTIAHELGHLLLNRLRGPTGQPDSEMTSFRGNQGDEERFCNQFAAFLLIPSDGIRDLPDWESITIAALSRRARELQVSLSALLWRVLESRPSDGGAIWFKLMSTPTKLDSRRLRVDWSIFPSSAKTYIPRYAAVPKLSPIEHSLRTTQESFHSAVPLALGNLRTKRALRVQSFGERVLTLVMPSTRNRSD